jgi:CBS domain-containing protein
MKVRDAMTTDVKTVGPEASLKDVAAILAEHRISGVPVVDEDRRVLGVVTKADIIIKELGEAPTALHRLLHHREATAVATKVAAQTAGEAMNAPPITVEPGYPLAEAAEVMVEHGVNRLPVVEDDRLVGIVTRFDLVRAFARSDAEIERDIREEALAGLSWPEELQLTVSGGDVTLRGEVDSKFDAEAVPASIRRIPGVVSVDSELRCWDLDSNTRKVVAVRL